jgi:1,4-dihydroxy-2-naphthoate octaprenyltransferase
LVSAAASAVLTLLTLWEAFGTEALGYLILFLVLGAFAIWASIRYTIGSNAYGYRGLGDLFVFVFFGLLSVLGSLFLYTRQLDATALLPATAIGALSTAVLNLNNLRDSASDEKSGKRTLVVQMGYRNGVRYHFALCLLALVCMLWFVLLQDRPGLQALCLLPFAVVGVHLGKVARTREPASLDPELKKLALSTFFIALLMYFVNHYFL